MRLLLTVILPLLLPSLLFLLWAVATRGRAPDLGSSAWLWSIGGGLVLLLVILGIFGVRDRADPGSAYVPAQMQGGEVLPGHIDSRHGDSGR